MEAFLGLRVSEGILSTAAVPRALIYTGSARCLADGNYEHNAPYGSWSESVDGKDLFELNHDKLRFSSFKGQRDFFTAASEILCLEFYAPKQRILTLSRLVTPSNKDYWHRYSKPAGEYGGKRVMPAFMPHCSIPGIRSTNLGRNLKGKTVDRVRGGSKAQGSRCYEAPSLSATQIWDITTSTPPNNRGFEASFLLTSDKKFSVPRTPASSHLYPTRQKQDKKVLQSPSRLLSQFGRGKQISGFSAPYQIQIKLLSGKTLLQWVKSSDLVQDLKQALKIKLGIPSTAQRLLHEGKQLEDLFPLSFYSIQRNSSIALTLRLRGGTAGQSSSAKAFSYKEAVHGKMPERTVPPAQALKPFLVDKLEESPSIEIKHPSLDEQTQHFAEHGIICRFNGLWPRTADLYQWIQSNWTNNCKTLLCSKGFFIVVFAFEEDYQKALTGGPWFWGAAGLFLTPWFPDFDPSTAVITKLPIWVRLPKLPANLWHFAVFQGIGNTLGCLLDTDVSRGAKGLYTYARICAEIDISKGLPDQINLKIGDFHWTQTLDYENTAFCCRICHHTGHLQSSCPTMPAQKKKANAKHKSKSWKPHDPPPMDDFDFSSDEEGGNKEDGAAASEPDPFSAGPADLSVIPVAQKRNHESSTSDSEKETSPSAHLSLQVVTAQQNPSEWVKVGKKKGKKCRIVDSAHVG